MKTTLWMLAFLATTSAWAQSSYKFTGATSTLGAMQRVKGAVYSAKALSDEQEVFQLRTEKGGLFSVKPYLCSYTKSTMQFKKQVPLKLENEGKTCAYENILLSNDKLYLFSSFYNGKQDANYLFVQTVDKSSLMPNKDLKKVAEITDAKSRNKAGGFGFERSRDKSKHLIYADIPRKRKENEAYSLTVLDAQMNTLWQKSIELPYTEQLFQLEAYHVDNDGNVYVLGLLFNEKVKEKVKGKPNYSYKVFKYAANQSDAAEFDIQLKDKFINDLGINVVDGLIICAGFYGNKSSAASTGIFYTSFDPNSKTFVKESYKAFDNEFLTANLGKMNAASVKRQAAKDRDVLYNYKFRDIVSRTDGGAVLMAEQYFVRVVTRRDPKTGAVSYTYYYYYCDIIVVNISPRGEIEWAKKIPKTQVTTNDNGYVSSYTFANKGDKLYFIFNDDIRNVPEPAKNGGYRMSFHKKYGGVTIAEIDIQGNLKRMTLSELQNTGTVLLAKSSEQTDSKEVILVNVKLRRLFSKAGTTIERLEFK